MLISPQQSKLQISTHSKTRTLRKRHKSINSTTLQINHQSPYHKKISHTFFIPRETEKWNSLVFSRLLLESSDEGEDKEKRKGKVSMINIYSQSEEQYAKTPNTSMIYFKHFLKYHSPEKNYDSNRRSSTNRSAINPRSQKLHSALKRTIKVSNPVLKERPKLSKTKEQNVQQLLITKLTNKKPEQSVNKKKKEKGLNLSTEVSKKPLADPTYNTISEGGLQKKEKKKSLKIRKKSSHIAPW